MVIGRVKGDAASELIHLNAALLPDKSLSYEERSTVWRTFDSIDTKTDLVEGDMIVIESFCLRLESVVVGQRAVVPVQTTHFVDIVADVDISLTGHKPV